MCRAKWKWLLCSAILTLSLPRRFVLKSLGLDSNLCYPMAPTALFDFILDAKLLFRFNHQISTAHFGDQLPLKIKLSYINIMTIF